MKLGAAVLACGLGLLSGSLSGPARAEGLWGDGKLQGTFSLQTLYGGANFKDDVLYRPTREKTARLTFGNVSLYTVEAEAKWSLGGNSPFVRTVAAISKNTGGWLNDVDYLSPYYRKRIEQLGYNTKPYPDYARFSDTTGPLRVVFGDHWGIDVGWNQSLFGAVISPFVRWMGVRDTLWDKGYFCNKDDVGNLFCRLGAGRISEDIAGVRYKLKWSGVRVGTGFSVPVRPDLTVVGNIGYLTKLSRYRKDDTHFARLAELGDPGFMARSSEPYGVMVDLGVRYALRGAWSVDIGGRYWQLESGDNMFALMAPTKPSAQVPLIAVATYKRKQGRVGLTYSF